jgi:hypothetical protein
MIAFIKNNRTLLYSLLFIFVVLIAGYFSYRSNANYQQWLAQQRALQQTQQK